MIEGSTLLLDRPLSLGCRRGLLLGRTRYLLGPALRLSDGGVGLDGRDENGLAPLGQEGHIGSDLVQSPHHGTADPSLAGCCFG